MTLGFLVDVGTLRDDLDELVGGGMGVRRKKRAM